MSFESADGPQAQEQPAEAPREREAFESPEFQERVSQEQQEARERFGDLIELVNERYESGNLSPAEREKFVEHNGEVLDYAVELGLRKELSEEEMKIVEISAILHDSTKADSLPEEFADIPNYGLVTHGERAAAEVGEILTDERLSEYGFRGHSPDEVREQVNNAILQHMGPHPGFMTDVLEGVNRVIENLNEALPESVEKYSLISHPRAQGRVSETLLAADMLSLTNANGRRKILAIHANSEHFFALDNWTVEKYRARGVEIRQGEAALLHAFKSALEQVEMITDPDDRKMLERVYRESMEEEYFFGDDPVPVTFAEASRKREEFEAKKREGAA